MYMHASVRDEDRQGGLHLYVPICKIYAPTGWCTCTNVSRMQTLISIYNYKYQRVQYADIQTAWSLHIIITKLSYIKLDNICMLSLLS